MPSINDLTERYRYFIHDSADHLRIYNYPLVTQMMAEMLGTALLIFFGDGSGAQSFFIRPDFKNFLSISLGWGAAVSVAIVVTGRAGPAILNPAIAVSNCVTGGLRFAYLPFMILVEIIGGVVGAGLVLAVYNNKIVNYAKTVDNNAFLVNTTGGIFVANLGSVSLTSAVIDQIIITAIMVFGIMAVADNKNIKKHINFNPFLIGMVVLLAVGTYSVNASSALNPARDFGPRLLLLMSHWGVAAFEHDNFYFWVPMLMPVVGALVGALAYKVFIGIHRPEAGGYKADSSSVEQKR